VSINILGLRDQLITDGIASVRANETRPERITGGIAGFELCRTLSTPEEYQRVLEQRHRMEQHMRREDIDPVIYWEYRIASVQIGFLFEHLRILWGIGETVSARAVLHLHKLLGDDIAEQGEK